MAVNAYRPQLSVKLLKNVGRSTVGGNVAASTRFTGAKKSVDLTPYMGEGDNLVMSRSVRDPAGTFSISVTDKQDPDSGDSLYGLFEPMDVIEVRGARDPSAYPPGQLPILFRGFVTNIRRTLRMTARGPQRGVTISGQDYGKILQIMNIVYLPGMVLGQELLTAFKLFLNYGVEAKPYDDAAQFIGDVVTKVVDPFLAQMAQGSSSQSGQSPLFTKLGVAATSGSGSVSPFGTQEWPGGSVYELMRFFGDVGPWNELYVEDRPDGPYLVYRPTPFRNISGGLIQSTASAPAQVSVTDSDLVELDVGRSDANVANYYWVDAPRFMLVDGMTLQAFQAGGQRPPAPYLDSYPNSSPSLYGIRVMRLQTEQGLRIDGQAEAESQSRQKDALSLLDAKRNVIIENNKDNVVLEEGRMVLKGNENIKHGCEVTLTRGAGGGMKATYYAYRVEHQFTFGGPFLTSVMFDRGTGFIVRAQRPGGASGPYLSEMTLDGAYA